MQHLYKNETNKSAKTPFNAYEMALVSRYLHYLSIKHLFFQLDIISLWHKTKTTIKIKQIWQKN